MIKIVKEPQGNKIVSADQLKQGQVAEVVEDFKGLYIGTLVVKCLTSNGGALVQPLDTKECEAWRDRSGAWKSLRLRILPKGTKLKVGRN